MLARALDVCWLFGQIWAAEPLSCSELLLLRLGIGGNWWDSGMEPNHTDFDGLPAWRGGTCTTCQQSSGSDSLPRMCFWHSSGPYARPLQITDRNGWDSIPSVSIRILPAGTTSYKKGCCCFLCSCQQWWCQYININHQIIRFIFLKLILLINWISLIFSKF